MNRQEALYYCSLLKRYFLFSTFRILNVTPTSLSRANHGQNQLQIHSPFLLHCDTTPTSSQFTTKWPGPGPKWVIQALQTHLKHLWVTVQARGWPRPTYSTQATEKSWAFRQCWAGYCRLRGGCRGRACRWACN